MLLRFSVSNFASLRDKQELSMIASKLKGEAKGLIEAPELRNETILPAAVIYGPNASGKSNFVKALARMRNMILNSHREGRPGEPLAIKPFALDPQSAEKPTVFEIDFICTGARYSYSFEAMAAGFVAESLHVSREGRSSLLFNRTPQGFVFGRSLKGRNKIIEDLTRNNSLYLSAAAQNNHEELSLVADFFRRLRVDTAGHISPNMLSLKLATDRVPREAIDLLREIDIGISDYKIDESPTERINVQLDFLLQSALRRDSGAEMSPSSRTPRRDPSLRFRLGHPASNGQPIYFDLRDESAGTLQLLSILGPIIRSLQEGRIVVFDEFGSRLHTRASEIILALFNNKETNPKGAQLVAATHDTNLLNATGLRRDQVWFTEKDGSGATQLYPLTDIETRKGDNLEKGYLQGRYGAIPFAGSLANFSKAG